MPKARQDGLALRTSLPWGLPELAGPYLVSGGRRGGRAPLEVAFMAGSGSNAMSNSTLNGTKVASMAGSKPQAPRTADRPLDATRAVCMSLYNAASTPIA